MKSQVRQVRKSNNIIEFVHYGPVYVQAYSQGSTIAWRRKQIKGNIGYAYEQYQTNKIRYYIVEDKLRVEVYQLKKTQSHENPIT